MKQNITDVYNQILHEELIPALGCTEPIAVAFTAAKAREVLGKMPESILVQCSGNVIKNVKGVKVPATEGMKGIDTSAVLGAIVGGSRLGLEVLTSVTHEDLETMHTLLDKGICRVELIEGVSNLQVIVTVRAGDDVALAEICGGHTNLVRVEKNGRIILKKDVKADDAVQGDRSLLNLHDIYTYARTAPTEPVAACLQRQIDYNLSIAEEGMTGNWGAAVGVSLINHYGSDVKVRARAMAAAGSDARMGGCTLPVVINSGSGNQGMTASLPVVVYASELDSDEEQLYRALMLSNLIAIYLKSGMGKLSAYCGAVGAACGAGAGIAFLHGESFEKISDTIVNTIANVSGIVCDGAKESCAAKIAASVDAAILGYSMAADGNCFHAGDGLVGENADATVRNISRLGRVGMRSTDVEILNMMIGQ